MSAERLGKLVIVLLGVVVLRSEVLGLFGERKIESHISVVVNSIALAVAVVANIRGVVVALELDFGGFHGDGIGGSDLGQTHPGVSATLCGHYDLRFVLKLSLGVGDEVLSGRRA